MNEKTSNIARDDVELLQEAGPMMKRSDGKRASKWRGNRTVAVVRQDELSVCDLVRVKGVATRLASGKFGSPRSNVAPNTDASRNSRLRI